MGVEGQHLTRPPRGAPQERVACYLLLYKFSMNSPGAIPACRKMPRNVPIANSRCSGRKLFQIELRGFFQVSDGFFDSMTLTQCSDFRTLDDV